VIPILAALTFVGRIFLILYWFAVGTLLAGVAVWALLVERTGTVGAILTGVILALPGVWLLHFQWVLRAARRRVLDAGLTRMSLYRAGHLSVLLLPWYWAGVVVSTLAGLALIPTAIIAALLSL
jgi:hypothetical protein